MAVKGTRDRSSCQGTTKGAFTVFQGGTRVMRVIYASPRMTGRACKVQKERKVRRVNPFKEHLKTWNASVPPESAMIEPQDIKIKPMCLCVYFEPCHSTCSLPCIPPRPTPASCRLPLQTHPCFSLAHICVPGPCAHVHTSTWKSCTSAQIHIQLK